MKCKALMMCFLLFIGGMTIGQEVSDQKASIVSKVTSVEYVSSLLSRPNDLIPAIDIDKEVLDSRSLGNLVIPGKDPQTEDDYYVRNRKEMEQSIPSRAPSVVFDAYSSSAQPTDPSLAIGPNHVFVVYNTGFTIYDKSGNQLLGQTAPSPAIFPNGGCCDLTVSYDNAADRWVLTFLSIGNGAQIAVSQGPNPLTTNWFVYTISSISDYQKLSVWSDGYYITDNTTSSNKVWALERDAMLLGSPNAQVVGFNLSGLSTFGFYSPQVLNVTDDNTPAPGGATVIYLQDDAWSGVSEDHIKFWTINVDWNNPGSSTISAPVQFNVTPFINVFDNGSFSNLRQPGNGRPINVDALQAIIMNQAQFRKFATHNSAIFNFVVDTDASNEELAGIRWYEFRQNGDNTPWELYQEGTYTAPDGRHAWNASMAMDAQGNIGMGYSSMSGPNSSNTTYIGSYYTGRGSSDPLGTMTLMEGTISAGTGKIPGTRYGDYSKMDVDPVDGQTFWFINEYYKSGRKGVAGAFQVQAAPPDTEAPTTPTNLTVNNVTASSASLSWSASTDNVGVTSYNVYLDGNLVGTTSNTNFDLLNLSPLTSYTAAVNAQDAAGNVSGDASTVFTTSEGSTGSGEIAAFYFETGFEGWSDPGRDCTWQSTTNSYEGSYSIQLRDGSSSSNSTSPSLDFSGNASVTIDFWFYASGTENGDSFFVEYSDGGAFQVVGQYVSGTDFTDNTFNNVVIALDSGNYNLTSNASIRIRNNMNQKNDRIWFDQVIITGDASNAPIVFNGPSSLDLGLDQRIALYPNPTNQLLNIEILEGSFDEINIYNTLGVLLTQLEGSVKRQTVDVSNFESGVYYITFVSNGVASTKRFIKQ